MKRLTFKWFGYKHLCSHSTFEYANKARHTGLCLQTELSGRRNADQSARRHPCKVGSYWETENTMARWPNWPWRLYLRTSGVTLYTHQCHYLIVMISERDDIRTRILSQRAALTCLQYVFCVRDNDTAKALIVQHGFLLTHAHTHTKHKVCYQPCQQQDMTDRGVSHPNTPQPQ